MSIKNNIIIQKLEKADPAITYLLPRFSVVVKAPLPSLFRFTSMNKEGVAWRRLSSHENSLIDFLLEIKEKNVTACNKNQADRPMHEGEESLQLAVDRQFILLIRLLFIYSEFILFGVWEIGMRGLNTKMRWKTGFYSFSHALVEIFGDSEEEL